MAYLNLGTGLAAGLVLQGKLWRGSRGSRGAAGEIGRILIDPAGPLDAATRGDIDAIAIRRRLFEAVASSVRILVLTLDVDLVVIGGGIGGLGDALLAAVREVISAGERRTSPFLASLQLGERIRILPPDIPTAATGAAWLGATPWQR